MICNRIVDELHLVDKKNEYIVDTNILLYLYGDSRLITENKKIKSMAYKFNVALDNGCKVYVPSMVISEFINRYHKLEFNQIKKKNSSRKLDYKKDYRNSHIFIENNKFIINTVKNTILDRCKLISDDFENANINAIFSENENQEFNDNLLIDIANRNNLYLISADIDTKKIKIN